MKIYSRASIIRIPIIRNIGYPKDIPKDNPKPKPPKPKANIAGFLAVTWRQASCQKCLRNVNVLSFTDGASGSSLDRKYGVGNATISDIKKNSDAITNHASALDNEDGRQKTEKRLKWQKRII
ncbi:hypothetical protein LAZ67_4002077 [Cordylochernes scorpioides]|uniref:Uncharacterized protein n=1 Tax=Cordylochernes scorpioides TaxID=51811 RepID=A0ABY6KFK8_9ARAC|nr:hypothetical protein LAZ67_4002077 [Cordylochernes scorpioides]